MSNQDHKKLLINFTEKQMEFLEQEKAERNQNKGAIVRQILDAYIEQKEQGK